MDRNKYKWSRTRARRGVDRALFTPHSIRAACKNKPGFLGDPYGWINPNELHDLPPNNPWVRRQREQAWMAQRLTKRFSIATAK